MIKLGTMVRFSHETQGLGELKTAFENVKKYGLPTCQLCCWDMSKFTDENAAGIREIVKETGVEISALWCGWEVAPRGISSTDTTPSGWYPSPTAHAACKI